MGCCSSTSTEGRVSSASTSTTDMGGTFSSLRRAAELQQSFLGSAERHAFQSTELRRERRPISTTNRRRPTSQSDQPFMPRKLSSTSCASTRSSCFGAPRASIVVQSSSSAQTPAAPASLRPHLRPPAPTSPSTLQPQSPCPGHQDAQLLPLDPDDSFFQEFHPLDPDVPFASSDFRDY
jgi:hypothetical protein